MSSSQYQQLACIDEEPASLNAVAVSILQQGNNRKAVALLTHAFHCLDRRRGDDDREKFASPDRSRLFTANQNGLRHQHLSCPSPSPELFSCAIVYNRAFLVSHDSPNRVKQAVILYNAGLACHREGLFTCSSHFLTLGLDLYKTAYLSIIATEQQKEQNLGMRCATCIVLLAALSNNLAQISSEFFQINEAREWRRVLGNILEWSSTDGDAIIFMELNDYEFFNRSLFYSFRDDFTCAPAA